MRRSTFENLLTIIEDLEAELIHNVETNTTSTHDELSDLFLGIRTVIKVEKPMTVRQQRRFDAQIAKLDEALDRYAYVLVNDPDMEFTDEEKCSSYECLTGGKDYPASQNGIPVNVS